jgi:hypothetical protein
VHPVAAIDQLLPKLDARVRIVSKDRKLVEWSPTLRNVFVKDPNGLNIEIVGTREAELVARCACIWGRDAFRRDEAGE